MSLAEFEMNMKCMHPGAGVGSFVVVKPLIAIRRLKYSNFGKGFTFFTSKAKQLSSFISRLRVRPGFGCGVLSRLQLVNKRVMNFADKTKLYDHFVRHGGEFGIKNVDDYLKAAQMTIDNGIKVAYRYNGELRIGYVQFMGTSGKKLVSKFAFVGTNKQGFITTFHVESGNSFWKMLNGSSVDKTIRGIK
jgi:hypothetical protein